MKPSLIVTRTGGKSQFAALFFFFLISCSTPSFAQCWKQVAPTFNHAVALKEDGTLWAWGVSSQGQLGTGSIIPAQVTPLLVGTATDWAYITAGSSCTLAIKTDGTLWAWGNNGTGQLGIGNTTNQFSPVQVGTATNWARVWASPDATTGNTIGLKTDGTLWAWGANGVGQLGIGNTTQQNSPVQVGTDADWARASTGSHTLAIKTNGTLWAWGTNATGQLGIGNTTQQNSPVQVGTDADWASVEEGQGTSVAVKTNGTLWAWGNNTGGQLGIGNTTQQNSPVQVGTDADWVIATSGSGHVLALKTNGTLWGWGGNGSGQLGDGTFTSHMSPVQMGTSNDWAAVSAGYVSSAAIKTDKTIWLWGLNNNGQLGINNKVNQGSPVQGGFGTYPAALPALTGGGAATLLASCQPDIFGYYSYRHPTAITRKLFAIHPEGNSGTFTVVYDTSRNTNSTPLVQSDATGATSLMGRLVTVSYSGTLGAGVRVRFFYSSADSTNTSNALDSWISANPGSSKQWQWIKYEGDAAAMAGNQTVGGFSGTYTKLSPDSSGVENGISFVEFWNITSFSTFGAVAFANTTNTPLPITLHDFTATLQEHCAAVKLEWSTDLEQNSRNFSIMRSTDGSSWSDIAAIAAAGNSSGRKNYSYTDAGISSQVTYFYRLQLNDLDGNRKYSNILSVRPDCGNGESYLIYPNPVKDLVTIQMPLTGGPKVAAVYNSMGQRIVQLILKPGAVQTIPASGWSKGIYLVVITENGTVKETRKVMKQ